MGKWKARMGQPIPDNKPEVKERREITGHGFIGYGKTAH